SGYRVGERGERQVPRGGGRKGPRDCGRGDVQRRRGGGACYGAVVGSQGVGQAGREGCERPEKGRPERAVRSGASAERSGGGIVWEVGRYGRVAEEGRWLVRGAQAFPGAGARVSRPAGAHAALDGA